MRVSDLFESLDKDLVMKIRAECTKATALLHRGLYLNHNGALPKPMGQMETHAERKPKDSAPSTQVWVDKELSKRGFKALRHNSLFTNPRTFKFFLGQPDNPSINYGSGLKPITHRMNFWIMPMDSANITFNPNVMDLFGEFSVEPVIDGYTSDWYAVRSNREVMVSGQFYYFSLFGEHFEIAKGIMEALIAIG